MRLTHEQIQAIREEADRYKAAVAQASMAQIALWQTHIDIAIAAGVVDLNGIFISPVADN